MGRETVFQSIPVKVKSPPAVTCGNLFSSVEQAYWCKLGPYGAKRTSRLAKKRVIGGGQLWAHYDDWRLILMSDFKGHLTSSGETSER